MAANAFDILLRYVLDKETFQQVQQGTLSVQEAMQGQEDANYAVGVAAIRLQPILDAQYKKTAELQNAWWKTQRVMRAASFTFQQLALTGTALTAPLVALAVKFVAEMEKAGLAGDPIVKEWKTAMDSIKGSSMEIGRVVATVLLPLLNQAAEVATKITGFVKEHPQVIEAALKIGAAVASVGVLGKLVTEGVKMYVDIKFVAASTTNLVAGELMLEAAKQNMLAAIVAQRTEGFGAGQDILENLGRGTGGAAASLLKSYLPTILPIVVTAVALFLGVKTGIAFGNDLGKEIYGDKWKDQDLGDVWTTAKRSVALVAFATNIRRVFDRSEEGTKAMWEQAKAMFGLKEAADATSGSLVEAAADLELLKKEAEGAQILRKLGADLAKMQREYERDRVKVIEDANRRLAESSRDYARALVDAATNLNRTLGDLAEDYARDQQKAEERYYQERQKAIQDSNEEIEKLRRDHYEKLRQMELEHQDRVIELIANRDALGLVRENRKYARDVQEENRSFQLEQRERRRELQLRLQQMQQEFVREQQERREQYERDRQEALEQYARRIEELRTAHAEEMEEIRRNRDEKLKEMREEFEYERRERVMDAYQKIAELGGALEAERKLRTDYYALYMSDLKGFAEAYRLGLAEYLANQQTTEIPQRQAGGYATHSGIYRLAEQGRPEFVMSNQTMKAAEMIVGGRLSQRNILAALVGGRRGTVTINDHRRFDSRIGVEDRRQIARETLSMVMEALQA